MFATPVSRRILREQPIRSYISSHRANPSKSLQPPLEILNPSQSTSTSIIPRPLSRTPIEPPKTNRTDPGDRPLTHRPRKRGLGSAEDTTRYGSRRQTTGFVISNERREDRGTKTKKLGRITPRTRGGADAVGRNGAHTMRGRSADTRAASRKRIGRICIANAPLVYLLRVADPPPALVLLFGRRPAPFPLLLASPAAPLFLYPRRGVFLLFNPDSRGEKRNGERNPGEPRPHVPPAPPPPRSIHNFPNSSRFLFGRSRSRRAREVDFRETRGTRGIRFFLAATKLFRACSPSIVRRFFFSRWLSLSRAACFGNRGKP